MRLLVVVRRVPTHIGVGFSLEERARLGNLRFQLAELFAQTGIATVQIIGPNSYVANANAAALASLSQHLHEQHYLINRELNALSFPYTRQVVRKHVDADAVILVCAGSMADGFIANYGDRELGITGLDRTPIEPAHCRILDCETGQVSLAP